MPRVSITRFPVRPGAGAEVERIAEEAFAERRAWLRRGDLRATYLARSDDQTEYVVISVWASKAADEAHENSPGEQAARHGLGQHLAGPPSEFTGDVIVEIR